MPNHRNAIQYQLKTPLTVLQLCMILYKAFVSSKAKVQLGLSAAVFCWIMTFTEGERLCAQNEWPKWRGPNGNGSSDDAMPPEKWNESTNVAWKADITGLGSSTPIVWGKQVIIMSSEEMQADPKLSQDPIVLGEDDRPMIKTPGMITSIHSLTADAALSGHDSSQRLTQPRQRHRFLVSSYDLESGAKNWETVVLREFPHEPCHATNNFASSSPVTDGKSIYAFFGSRGIFCLDMSGSIKWHFDLGQQQTLGSFGEGASPALYQDYLVIPWDNERDSCLIALNATNGYLRWKVARQERTNWATPIIVEHKGTKQVIASGKTVRSYELETGRLIWSCSGQTDQAIPTPVSQNGRVIVTSGFRGSACYSLSLDATNTVASDSPSIQWFYNKASPYVPSPCVYRGKVFLFQEKFKKLVKLEEETGDESCPSTRLWGIDEIYSSIGAADGKVFLSDRSGKTFVVDTETLQVLSINQLDEALDASPVFVGRRLLLRGESSLYCLMDKSRSTDPSDTTNSEDR